MIPRTPEQRPLRDESRRSQSGGALIAAGVAHWIHDRCRLRSDPRLVTTARFPEVVARVSCR